MAMIEIVTAIFIVTFGLFAMLNMYHFGLSKARTLREQDMVMNALQNEIDALRAKPFSELSSDWDAGFIETEPVLGKVVGLETHLTIQALEPDRLDLLQVAASIQWRSENGRLIKKTLTTLIADKSATER